MKRTRHESERLIQQALFDHVGWRKNPGWHIWHVPNAAKRSPWLGADLKRQGLVPGVGDISVVSPEGRYFEMELKTAKGKLSPAQRLRQEQLRASRVTAETAYGLDQALAMLVVWGAIR